MSNESITKKINILKIDDGFRSNITDEVVSEYSLSIIVNNEHLVTLICSKCNLQELAVGHLFSNGLISSFCDIVELVIAEGETRAVVNLYIDNRIENSKNAEKNQKIITSSSGRQFSYCEDMINKLKKDERNVNIVKFDSKKILDSVKTFCNESEGFNLTGGIHSCKLCGPCELVIHREDIGRHNAFDKVIGAALIENVDFQESYIITSGRVPSDMVIKAVTTGVPLLVSKSAPTDVSVQIAQEMGLCLIGFARGKRLNLYTFPNRII